MKKRGVSSTRGTLLDADAQARLVDRYRMTASFRAFVDGAWHIVEPELELLEGIHLDAICLHLEAVADGRIRKLLINIPPGHAKSLIVAVLFPAWMWLRRPTWRALFASYSKGLAIRDSTRCRRLIQSHWYQQTFRPAWKMAGDQNVKSYFENTAGGFRLALSCGSKAEATGYRGDATFIDDPLSVEQAESDNEREKIKRWNDKTYSSRLNDKRTGARVVVGQRLHIDDLSAHLLENKQGWVHLNLPTEFDPENRCKTIVHENGEDVVLWEDPRTEDGELLFPALFTPEVIDEAREDLGAAGFSAQHNQDPAPPGGRKVKNDWVKGVSSLPDSFEQLIQSWDLSLGSKSKRASYCVGELWGKRGADFYLIDQVRGKWELPEILAQVRSFSAKHPEAAAKVIENKAFGPGVLQMLQREIPGLIAFNPGSKDKLERLMAVLPYFEAGNVRPLRCAPWYDEWRDELTTFPGARNDDQVDATTQALAYLTQARRKVTVSVLGGRRR